MTRWRIIGSNIKIHATATTALFFFLLCVGVAVAQQPTPSPTKSPDAQPANVEAGEDHGGYTLTSSIEFGYRGISVDGDHNKYRSDLNYSAGPRLFDSTFLMKAKEGGGGGFFDTLLVTSTGWGADPHGQVRVNVENPKWYKFDGTYRKFKYFRFVNNFVNPKWVFS